MRVIGWWSLGQWIVGVIGVIRFQTRYGLYGLKYHIVEISRDVTPADERKVESRAVFC